MTFSRRILSRPMTMIIVFIVATIAGGVLTTRLATDLLPDMNIPGMAVVTTYPMATPSEVEEDVTKEIEEELVNISGLDSLTSYSYDDYSLIIMMMDYDVDISDATADVRDALDGIENSLPEDCYQPTVFQFDPNSQAVIKIALTGDQGLEDLLKLAEEELQPQFERISGVAEVALSGGLEEIVQVSFYQERLDALGLSINTVSSMLSAQNMSLGAGSLVDGGMNYLIETNGEIGSLDDLANTVVSIKPLGPSSAYEVLLRDVADVGMGTKDRDSIVLINGQEGIQISIKKTDDANMVEVVDEVKLVAGKMQEALPYGNTLTILSDNSVQVNSVLQQVINSAILGILFAVIVLIFFIRRIKTTLIVAISIPVSLLITIGGMSMAGKTFNMITLTGLILALGMIVDGSIVVIENIFRYRQKGALQKTSAELGTQEVIGAITSSILTSICVFLPILIFKNDLGMIGIMFEDMAFTIVVALLASLAVSVLLVPVLASKVFPIYTREEKPIKSRALMSLDSSLDKSNTRFTNGYRKAVGWCLNHKIIIVAVSLILLAGSIVQLPQLGLIMVPPSGETSIILDVTLPEGTALKSTEEAMLQWQYIAESEIPESERQNIVVTSGAAGGMGTSGGSHTGTLEISLPAAENRTMTDTDIKEILRSYFELFPDATISFSTTDQARMMTGSSDVSINFHGNDLDDLVKVSNELTALVKAEIPEVLEITSSHSNALPELELELDRQKLFDLGLNTATIANELRAQIAGTTATTMTLDGETYDVVLQLREEDRDSTFDIDKIFVTTATGAKVPFSNFGEVKKTTGPMSIYREDRVKTITLSGDIAPGSAANFVQGQIESLVDEKLVLPEGVTTSTGGQMEMIADMTDGLILVFIFAALLVFAVMVSQFESLKSPFIIFAMIPMLLIGVVGIYLIIGEPLSMPSLIGIVMLLGLVVNNGIILVDSINLHRKRGLNVFEACREAAANRLRPVLMTTLTTVLAMVPMAFSGGTSTDMVKPIGLTVIGGLTSNTIITLFLVPVLYLMLHRKAYKQELPAIAEAQND
ncbi:MAG: efflux RND transporter permease subunit [Spirochaetales bacterium]|uniref:Efflux RND transporter permease subunit n=1 Tax=Candidatus Thalassospirochaeta sargassi TaxID=3119039 RepID=A0AAJ1IDD9_9SPIO|nr:efflux RND transporter permease subunit [Spirochaetales bacterium]